MGAGGITERCFRPVAVALLIGLTVMARAQSGVSMSFASQEVHGQQRSDAVLLALRYDNTITDHLGFGVDLGFAPVVVRSSPGFGANELMKFMLDYRAYYLVGDGDRTTVVVGSHTGLHFLEDTNGGPTSLCVPLGLRASIRGGLEDFFGEFFVEGGYQFGGRSTDYTREQVSLGGPFITIGFGYGLGWD